LLRSGQVGREQRLDQRREHDGLGLREILAPEQLACQHLTRGRTALRVGGEQIRHWGQIRRQRRQRVQLSAAGTATRGDLCNVALDLPEQQP